MGRMKELKIRLEEVVGKEEAEELASTHLSPSGSKSRSDNSPRPSNPQDREIIALLLQRIQSLKEQFKEVIEERNRILSYHHGLHDWTERELLVELLWRIEQERDTPWGLSDGFLEKVYRISGQELLNRDLQLPQAKKVEHREGTGTRRKRTEKNERRSKSDGRPDREDQPAQTPQGQQDQE